LTAIRHRPSIARTGDFGVFTPNHPGSGHDPQLARPTDRLGAPLRAQLLEQPRHVRLDRVRRDVEVRGDLLVGVAGRQFMQYFQLAPAQPQRGLSLGVAVEGGRCCGA